MNEYEKNLDEAVRFLQDKLPESFPKTALILGSGLSELAESMHASVELQTTQIPHWPVSTVHGHPGRLIIGKLEGTPLVILQGRVHYYEGYPIQQVVFPVRVLALSGIQNLLVTNAAGGLNPSLLPGDLMIITDHINLMGTNPLIGESISKLGPRFPDMSEPYSKDFIRLAMEIGEKNNIPLKKGILIATMGASYETAAEVRMMQMLGGDAVCMSTVPEVIAAVQMGLHVLGISTIANPATGLTSQKLSHQDVQGTAARAKTHLIRLIRSLMVQITQT